MKKITNIIRFSIFSSVLLLVMQANAQQLNMDVRDFDGNMQVYDPANPSKSKGTKLSYAEVEGSAFWSDQWNPAIIYFSNGSKAKINQARLNLYTNEIHYLSSNGEELALDNNGIVRLVFLNKNNLTQPIASFAVLMNHLTGNATAYYKVLNAGMFQLIVLQKQLVKTSPYDPIQAKSITSFYSKKDYAIYNEGKIIPLRDLDKSSVLAAIPLDILTRDWLSYSKSKLKSEKEVVEYLEQVNLSHLKINGLPE
jgi:hypothetical protein